jgi:hypothetical protein
VEQSAKNENTSHPQLGGDLLSPLNLTNYNTNELLRDSQLTEKQNTLGNEKMQES